MLGCEDVDVRIEPLSDKLRAREPNEPMNTAHSQQGCGEESAESRKHVGGSEILYLSGERDEARRLG
jgi:hypothetical protein